MTEAIRKSIHDHIDMVRMVPSVRTVEVETERIEHMLDEELGKILMEVCEFGSLLKALGLVICSKDRVNCKEGEDDDVVKSWKGF